VKTYSILIEENDNRQKVELYPEDVVLKICDMQKNSLNTKCAIVKKLRPDFQTWYCNNEKYYRKDQLDYIK
jgi:hypothetical protein